jgi:hypothetical protein
LGHRNFTLGALVASGLPLSLTVDESADATFPPDDDQLRAAVLAYVAEHPRAMDTLEGIAEWWISRHQIRVNVHRLVSVLEHLTNGGLLESVDVAGERMYRLARSQRGEE